MTPEAWGFLGASVTALLALIGTIATARKGKDADDELAGAVTPGTSWERLTSHYDGLLGSMQEQMDEMRGDLAAARAQIDETSSRLAAAQARIGEMGSRLQILELALNHIALMYERWGSATAPAIPKQLQEHLPRAVVDRFFNH